MIGVGSVVVVHLGSPREQVFGVVLSMQGSGLVVRGLTLSSVDDWIRGLAGESEMGVTFDLATTFYPMHRVEKVTLDEAAFGAPSIQERYRQRTGRDLRDLAGGGVAGPDDGR